jgi:DNA-binding NarL/FixJ family response regulator
MRIKVVLAFSNSLFAEGVGKLFENDPELEVISVIEPGEVCSAVDLNKIPAGVILTDFTSLYNSLPEVEDTGRKHHILLLDTSCGRENLVSAVLRKKVSGVLMSNSDSAQLKKAVKAIHKGEIWLDKSTFKSILNGINAISGDKNTSLSTREREIVALIGKGLRNKEIASRLNITETTVKTHLTRIFQKLNIKARSELISYAIKTDDLNHVRPNQDF